MSVWAMAFSMAAMSNTWLRNWNVDPSVQAKVAAVPFRSIILFWEGLGKYLVSDKEKKVFLSETREVMKTVSVLSRVEMLFPSQLL